MFLRFENPFPNLSNRSLVPEQTNRLPSQMQNRYHGNIAAAPALNFPEFFISCSHVEMLD